MKNGIEDILTNILTFDSNFDGENNQIYVRDEYRDFYQIIMENLSLGSKYAVVTGNPGIGKSIFKYYFIWKYLMETNASTFVLEEEKNIFSCYSSGKVKVLTYQEALKDLSFRGFPYFIDLTDAVETSVKKKLNPSIAIIFSSPNDLRYKEFLKNRFARKYFMNAWTEAELIAALKLNNNPGKINEDEIKIRYTKFGGIPRHIFDNRVEVVEQKINNSFLAKGESCAKLIYKNGDMGDAIDLTITYNILLMVSSKIDNYLTYTFYPVSSDIFDKLKNSSEIIKRKLIFGYFSLQYIYPGLQAAVGLNFEKYAIYDLVSTNRTITILNGYRKYSNQKFNAESERGNKVESTRVVSFGGLKILDFNDVESESYKLESNVIYVQKSQNTQSIDYCMYNGTELYLFQVTVSKEHSLKFDGLNSFKSKVQTALNLTALTCQIVFVVPYYTNNAYHLEGIQPIVKKGKNIEYPLDKTSSEYQFALNQWILVLPE
jgi:RHS (Retrotransposon Hot Spot) family protein